MSTLPGLLRYGAFGGILGVDYHAARDAVEAQGYSWPELFPLIGAAERGIITGDQEWQRQEADKRPGNGGLVGEPPADRIGDNGHG